MSAETSLALLRNSLFLWEKGLYSVFEFGIAIRLLAMSLQLRSRKVSSPGAHTHDKSSSGSGIPVENRKACEVGVSSKSK